MINTDIEPAHTVQDPPRKGDYTEATRRGLNPMRMRRNTGLSPALGVEFPEGFGGLLPGTPVFTTAYGSWREGVVIHRSRTRYVVDVCANSYGEVMRKSLPLSALRLRSLGLRSA